MSPRPRRRDPLHAAKYLARYSSKVTLSEASMRACCSIAARYLVTGSPSQRSTVSAGWTAERPRRPTDICWLPDGTFFVADGYAGTRVVKFDANFNFIRDWGEPPVDPGILDVLAEAAVAGG